MITHGTFKGYTSGCRCPACTEANRLHSANYANRRYPKRRTTIEDEVNADLLSNPIDQDGFWAQVDNYAKVRQLADEAARS